MAQLRALVDEWFGPVLSGDALLFKAFPTDNEEPVVLVGPRPRHTEFTSWRQAGGWA